MIARLGFRYLCGLTAILLMAFAPVDPILAETPFSVRNSVEMKIFTDPFTRDSGATAKEAPDGRGFVVVTTQGHIDSNTLESSLWYFPRQPLADYLSGKQEVPPKPRLLFRKIGIPEAEQFNSYGSLLVDVHWASDSQSLLLLAEERTGHHHLYQISLDGKPPTDLTPHEVGDVISPTSQAGVSAYLVTEPSQSTSPTANRASIVLTGRSIYNVLTPEKTPDAPGVGPVWRLKAVVNGKTRTFPSAPGTYFPFGAAKIFNPSVSPNGRFVLTVTPVSEVPSEWSAYWSGYVTRHFVPSTSTSDRSGRDVFWPWQYAILDLQTGKTRSLFDAPTGFTLNAGSVYEAKWSHSGETLVATYTFLPLDPTQAERDNSVRACAIAEYSLKTQIVTCLPQPEQVETGEVLISVDHDLEDKVVGTWSLKGKQIKRVYDSRSRAWTSVSLPAEGPTTLSIYIRQDIDARPVLRVKDATQDKLLWDANPQLNQVRFAKASPYSWIDESGHRWRAGLVLPYGSKPPNGYPLVIQTHGFYNEHEFLVDGAFTTASAAQPLACAGIAVLQMEDRSDKHTRPPSEEATDAMRGFESAIQSLAHEKIIDPSKIGIEGFSRTSWYVEKAIEEQPQKYAAALLSDGVDMSYVQDVLFTPGYDELRSSIEGANGGAPLGANLSKWFSIAAGFNLYKVQAAVRLEAHGIASVFGEWEIYSILKQNRTPVDLIQIPDGQHILQQPAQRYASQQGAVDWFRFWLQGHERSNPEDAMQYDRWRTLKTASSHAVTLYSTSHETKE